MNQSLGFGLGLGPQSLGLGLGLETQSLGLGLGLVDPSLDYITGCKQKQRWLRGLLCRWPSITEWEVHITAQRPRLRNDLYYVEWALNSLYIIWCADTNVDFRPTDLVDALSLSAMSSYVDCFTRINQRSVGLPTNPVEILNLVRHK